MDAEPWIRRATARLLLVLAALLLVEAAVTLVWRPQGHQVRPEALRLAPELMPPMLVAVLVALAVLGGLRWRSDGARGSAPLIALLALALVLTPPQREFYPLEVRVASAVRADVVLLLRGLALAGAVLVAARTPIRGRAGAAVILPLGGAWGALLLGDLGAHGALASIQEWTRLLQATTFLLLAVASAAAAVTLVQGAREPKRPRTRWARSASMRRGLLLLLLLCPTALAAEEGMVVGASEGETIRWSPGAGDYWLRYRAGAEGAIVALSHASAATMEVDPETGEPIDPHGTQAPFHARGTRVDLSEGEEATLLVREGSVRAMLLRNGLERPTSNGTVSVLRAEGRLEPGACEAQWFSSSNFGMGPGAVTHGPVVVEAAGVGMTLRLLGEDFEPRVEAQDVLATSFTNDGFERAAFAFSALQACAGEEGGAYVLRVTRTAQPVESATVPVPAWLVAAPFAAAVLRRRG